MHVIISEPDKLHGVLRLASLAVAKTDTNPIQSALKLWTHNDKLMVTAVDTTSHQLTLSVEANVQVPGMILIEAESFAKIIPKLGMQVLTLESDPESGVLQVRTASGADVNFNLFSGDVEDFPMEANLPPAVATVGPQALRAFLTSLNNGTLNKEGDIGFATIEGENKLRGYVGDATVGLLVRCEAQLVSKEVDFSFRVPYSTMRRVPDFQDTVSIHIGEGVVVLSKGDDHLLVRVADTEVNMEDYDFLFDKETSGYVAVSSHVFRENVGTLRVTRNTHVAKLVVDADARTMMMSAHDFSRCSIKLPIGLGDVGGRTPPILLDASCLDRAIMSIGSDTCMVSYLVHEGDDTEIWILKLSDEDNPNATQAVVLPIQE